MRRRLTLPEKLDKVRQRLLAERYNRDLVDDCLQAACLKALERGLDLEALPASWFYATAGNIAKNALKRDSRQIPTGPDRLDQFVKTRPQTGS